VITPWHYDWSDNFHAVLHGSKRVLLRAPESHWTMELYPYLHPRATKSQRAFVNDGTWMGLSWLQRVVSFTMDDEPETWEVVLEAGDVLYLPPLWFHQVESVRATISLSMWTPLWTTEVANQLLQQGLPVPSGLMAHELLRPWAVMTFLYDLLVALGSSPGYPHVFAGHLLQSRYSPLFVSEPQLHPPPPSRVCPSHAPSDTQVQEWQRLWKEELESSLVPAWRVIPSVHREMWLADYVEVALLAAQSNQARLVPQGLACLMQWSAYQESLGTSSTSSP